MTDDAWAICVTLIILTVAQFLFGLVIAVFHAWCLLTL